MSYKKIFAAIVAVQLILASGLAFADEEPAKRDSKSRHKFNHNFEYNTLEYKDVLGEAAWGGFKGGLIGLGTGLAISMITYSLTDREQRNAGRMNAGLFGVGFIGGALYAGINASMVNSRLEDRQDKLLEKYGSIMPTIQLADQGVGFGLAYSLKFN